MKKNIIVCGLIAGGILAVFMAVMTARCYKDEEFKDSMWLGYSAMVLSFSLIFVGIKNFRDKYNDGFVSFGKAFQIGLGITFIASTVYVLVWLVDYYVFMPDFMDKYVAHVLKVAREEGESAAEMNKTMAQMASYQEMYKNPILVILLTYAEVLPIGLVISLISALILKKKTPGELAV